MPDLRDVPIKGWRSQHKGNGGGDSGKFSVAYHELARYVRRSGIESNMRQLTPMEFHASTTELVQMLRKGHHGVRLDKQAWDRVITWIDLNAPYHGTWTEIVGAARVSKQAARRRELMKRYAGVDVDEEAICPTATAKVEPLLPDLPPKKPALKVTCKDWPFDKTEAERRQRASGKFERTIQLADGVDLKLVLIPAGQFVMGDAKGHEDEQPLSRVRIDKPYWMGRFEITNEQFAQFDPTHDSRVESKHGYQFGVHGYPVNGASQPVVRVSWLRAMAFCQWLSKRADDTGLEFTLPTEAQWEYACRAGTDSAFHYGDLDTDFSKFANLGDAKLKELAGDPYTPDTPMKNPNRFDDWVPKDTRFNDGALVSINVGTYAPNAWGLYDIHGNVAEWTRSSLRPYPWNGADGRNDVSNRELKVVRGGSWYDRPKRCRSSFRIAYRPYQPVYNVGFRVVAHEVTKRTAAKR
jgi:formylglycine-generating enzyme required for sulfatase activity